MNDVYNFFDSKRNSKYFSKLSLIESIWNKFAVHMNLYDDGR